jgi:hypothetical protein
MWLGGIAKTDTCGGWKNRKGGIEIDSQTFGFI